MVNWLSKTLGPMTTRPGLGYLGATRRNLFARPVPFIAGTTDTALIELTDTRIRVWVGDALVARPSVATSISNSGLTSATGWTDPSTNGALLSFSADGCALNTGGAGGNIATGLAAVVPVTGGGTGGRFEVPLPRGVKLSGVIFSHQSCTVDWLARNARFHAMANEDLILEVLGRIEAILAIEV
jgi:hypothetical protein